MAPARKPKQPEKKRKAAPQRKLSLGMRALFLAGSCLAATGRLAARNPATVGGSAVFIVVFSFVAANALWYQPGAHPSPFLRTRLPLNVPNPASIGASETGLDPKTVTTFVIKREGDVEAEEQAAQNNSAATPAQAQQQAAVRQPPATQPVQENTDDVAALIESNAAVVTPDPQTVSAIQAELARRGLYDGDADGKLGPRTRNAITTFEKKSGRVATGEANDALLAQLRKAEKPIVAATPDARPQTIKAEKGELDAVAAAIRQSDVAPQYIPKADIPASSELVMHIQQGLINLAYADVTIDGVAGDQTRAAIRHFEKHYRLPQTGVPSETVLRKMKDIGAL